MAEKTKLDQKTRKPLSTGQKEIVIDVEVDGNVVMEGFDLHDSCHDITKELENEIGEVIQSENKDDYYKKQPIVKKNKTGVTR